MRDYAFKNFVKKLDYTFDYGFRKPVSYAEYELAKRKWEMMLTDPDCDYDELENLESIMFHYEDSLKIKH